MRKGNPEASEYNPDYIHNSIKAIRCIFGCYNSASEGPDSKQPQF